ncbi:helix-turn-helix domain-containing protein [Archangium minus]|uniref:Helix-turn-helix domain-containing protein n=1 Tax=Archangium minus TaxID=83450 RepID=A0ABY9WM71_9BACT|nr:helix-turn-helix domain-containing protein [Archangium minus]
MEDDLLQKRLGEAARTTREGLGLTQAQVAQKAGMSPAVYGRIERGGMMPSVPALRRLSVSLGISPAALLERSTPWTKSGKTSDGRRVPSLALVLGQGLCVERTLSKLHPGTSIDFDRTVPPLSEIEGLFFIKPTSRIENPPAHRLKHFNSMRQISYALVTLLVVFVFATRSFAQTAVIDYQSWMPPSSCNVFASPKLVSGMVHATVVGEPSYSSINHSIVLDCKDKWNGFPKGSEYQIDFDFKQGHSYRIIINAVSIGADFPPPSLRLRINSGSNGSNSLAQCDGPDQIDTFSSGLAQQVTINSGGFLNYSLQFTALPSAQSKMLVAAIPESNGYATILIRSIIVEQIAPQQFTFAGQAQVLSSFGNDYLDPGSAPFLPITGDWNGDGKTDIGLKAKDGRWFIATSTGSGFTGQAHVLSSFGNDYLDPGGAPFLPVTGDWNGDGKTDIGLKAKDGRWFIATSTGSGFTGQAQVLSSFGNDDLDPGGAPFLPITGDWNGDGKTDIGLKAKDGRWFIATSTGSGFTGQAHVLSSFGNDYLDPGGAPFLPITGDWNGDGRTDIGLKAKDGRWFVATSTGSGFTGQAQVLSSFGNDDLDPGGAPFLPVTGDWNGDGRTDIGLKAKDGRWFIATSVPK